MLVGASLRDLGTDVRAQDVAIVDGSGNQVTTFSSVPVAPANAIITAPNVTTTDSVILAANVNRKKFLIQNDSGRKIFIAYGAVATAVAYTILLGIGNSYESEIGDFTGVIHAITSGGSGPIRVTELS